MCQISLINFGDDNLNRKLFLIMGSLGSTEHSDGWGFSNSKGDSWKCPLPMFLTSDAAIVLKNAPETENTPFLGHIRKASAKVEVITENAHPFKEEDVVFVHNGKLTPKDEDKFELEYEREVSDKDGKIKKEKFQKSDSELFLKQFVPIYNQKYSEGLRDDALFVASLKETMDIFYGKFAFVFLINGVYYVAKGKSANLYISYLRTEDSKDAGILGWAVNTSKEVLDSSCLLLSNLQLFDGKPPVYTSSPKAIPDEKIFRAGKFDLIEIGEIKENYTPVKSYTTYRAGETNFTHQGASGKSSYEKESEAYIKEIYDFMMEYSLKPYDIQILFHVIYEGMSLLDVTQGVLKHFVKRVIPLIRNYTNKDNKKDMKKALKGFSMSTYKYGNREYPWMLNPKNVQVAMIKELDAQK